MGATCTLEPVTDRAAWLAERRRTLGASEAAAAVGLDPYRSPLELYLLKAGALPDEEESEAARWGTLLEPVLAEEYARRTGNPVVVQQVRVTRPDVPWLTATLDGVTRDGSLVEFKTISAWGARGLGEDETDDLPERWIVQAHVQMFLADRERVDFAVLVGGQKLRRFSVGRNAALLGALLPRLAVFWRSVERREPPAPDPGRDGSLLTFLYPGSEGETALEAEWAEQLDRYEQLGREIRQLEATRQEYRSALLNRLGGHALGSLPDGRTLMRRVVAVPEQQVTRKAYSYTGLWVRQPKGGEM